MLEHLTCHLLHSNFSETNTQCTHRYPASCKHRKKNKKNKTLRFKKKKIKLEYKTELKCVVCILSNQIILVLDDARVVGTHHQRHLLICASKQSIEIHHVEVGCGKRRKIAPTPIVPSTTPLQNFVPSYTSAGRSSHDGLHPAFPGSRSTRAGRRGTKKVVHWLAAAITFTAPPAVAKPTC